LALAFCAFVAFAARDPHWSKSDVAALAAFAVLFVGVALATLIARGTPSTKTKAGVFRHFGAAFASLAGAFALCLLAGIVALPLVGFSVLERLFDSGARWLWLLLAVGLYPLVLRRLR
jgi:hypothetical protein